MKTRDREGSSERRDSRESIVRRVASRDDGLVIVAGGGSAVGPFGEWNQEQGEPVESVLRSQDRGALRQPVTRSHWRRGEASLRDPLATLAGGHPSASQKKPVTLAAGCFGTIRFLTQGASP